MPYVVTEPCIGKKDRACCEVCPADAFYNNPDKSLNEKVGRPAPKDDDYGMLFINPNECLHCGACQPECPVEAIYEDSSVPVEWSDYIQLAEKIANSYSKEDLEKHHATGK
ncbi:MAG: ferredoxin family protein [Deltaproteobacteria bacterium]|jgi:ferredoxin|nr:ferredoxin family protein [Deltaproteobacteria bacterium]